MKALGFGVALVLLATAASAQAQTPAVPGTFRVSLGREQYPVAGRVVGQVYNTSPFRVTDVRLDVHGFDADGREVGRTFAWTFGDIAPDGETSFEFEAIPEALSYRFGVVSYDVVAGPAGHESP